MIILLPLLVAVIGVLMYALATNPKVAEMGRLAYAVGLLVALLQVSNQTISILGQ